MKNLLYIIPLLFFVECTLVDTNSSNINITNQTVRDTVYRTVLEKCHITEILQSENDIMDKTDISTIAGRELDLRLEFLEKTFAELKIITKNGTEAPDDKKEELKKTRIKIDKYMFEIAQIYLSNLLPANINGEYISTRINKIIDAKADAVHKLLGSLFV
ncbi:hypothetical protein [Alistipes shahii]|uniref:hypothetical protein n=1 Tax=Alistipes shahii TaxID=328814 RepID=UPI00242A367B|nr:hypothetical protein [Alistipes shahii]MCI7592129.1 hypothetical protein [Alistipes shahii]